MAIVTLLAIETVMAIVTVLAIETDIHGYRDRPGHWNRHSWLSWPPWPSKPTFMAIVTALVIETDMAIVTVLASKPTWLLWPYWPRNRHGYRDHTGLETEIYTYCDRTGLETNMAIVTVLAIETDIHGYRDRLGHRNRHSWLLWPSWPSKPIFIIPKLNRVSSARKLFESSLRGTVYISLINAEVAKTITSLLCCCFFLPWDTLSHSDLSYYSWNKWYDLSPCEPCWKRWEHGHRRLGWSLSRLARDLSDAASFSPSKSFSQRSCHSRTVRNVDARSVGACPEDAKRKIRRTCLKDPGLTHVTWSRWYKPDGYLVGNADLSRGYLRLIAVTLLPLHWRLSQRPLPRSPVPGLGHLTVPR